MTRPSKDMIEAGAKALALLAAYDSQQPLDAKPEAAFLDASRAVLGAALIIQDAERFLRWEYRHRAQDTDGQLVWEEGKGSGAADFYTAEAFAEHGRQQRRLVSDWADHE